MDANELRIEFAKAALAGILSDHTCDLKAERLAAVCFDFAEEMVKEAISRDLVADPDAPSKPFKKPKPTV